MIGNEPSSNSYYPERSSVFPQINDNGYIAFLSNTLGFPESNGVMNLYLWHPSLKRIIPVSTSVHEAGFSNGYTWDKVDINLHFSINNRNQIAFSIVVNDMSDNESTHHFFWDPTEGLTLITNNEGEIGVTGNEKYLGSSDSILLNSFGEVVFESSDPCFPGSNGFLQVYKWSREIGVMLVSSVDGKSGCNAHCSLGGTDSFGNIVFDSTATDLPGGDGRSHVFIWGSDDDGVDEVVGIINLTAGLGEATVNYEDSQINAVGIVMFCSFKKEYGRINTCDIYTWDPCTHEISKVDISSLYMLDRTEDLVLFISNLYKPLLNDLGQVMFPLLVMREFEALGGCYGKDHYTELQLCLWDPLEGIKVISSPQATFGLGINSLTRYAWISNSMSSSGQIVFQAVTPDLPGVYGRWNLYLWSP